MTREFSRTLRVAEQIQRELARIIQQEMKDPRIGMVTISDVEVSADLAHARVFVNVLAASREDVKASLQVLNRASGFLRSECSRRLTTRTMPSLRFIEDTSMEQGNRLTALLKNATVEQQDNNEG